MKREVYRKLWFELTGEEIKDRSLEYVKLKNEANEADASSKALKEKAVEESKYYEEIQIFENKKKHNKARMKELTGVCSTGMELRDARCVWESDGMGMIKLVCLDLLDENGDPAIIEKREGSIEDFDLE